MMSDFSALAAELVRANVNIIVTTSVRGAIAAQQLTKNDPYRRDGNSGSWWV